MAFFQVQDFDSVTITESSEEAVFCRLLAGEDMGLREEPEPLLLTFLQSS
jgi:hypothetical protein